jgi:hypothetical protein
MIRVRTLLALAASLVAFGPGSAAGQSVTSCDTASVNARFVVKFNGSAWTTEPPYTKVATTTPAGSTEIKKVVTRITDRDRVEVCVEHLNFLRYTLKFDITEQQSEAYSYLTKLWASILLDPAGAAFSAFGPPPPPGMVQRPAVVLALHELYKASRALDDKVGATAAKYTKTGLIKKEAETLDGERGTVDGLLKTAREKFAAVDKVILDDVASFEAVHGPQKELFRATVEHYRGVEGRADVFLRLSLKAIGIEVKSIGKKKPGTKVTFTLAAVDQSGSSTPLDDVDYFVQSNMPLVAHGGLSFSGLRDVSFSKVRRATGFGEEDLFQQQSDDTSTGFALFLGWQFYGQGDVATNQKEGRIGAAFSLGTDVNAPGKRVFAGPSLLLFNRLVISGGAVFGKEAEGEAAAETLEPNLFRIIREKPKAKWFFAVSTKVF